MKCLKYCLFGYLYIVCNFSYAVSISTSQANYTPNESIFVQLEGMQTTIGYWVAIYPKGSDNLGSHAVSWPVTDVLNGAIELQSISAIGEYEARLFHDELDNVIGRVDLDIVTGTTESSEVTLDVSKPSYAPNESILVQLEGMQTTIGYWVAIYPKGSDNLGSHAVSWPVTDILNGTIELQSISAIGEYEARLFHDELDNVIGRVNLDIVADLSGNDCGTEWNTASFTHYTSYAVEGSVEWEDYSGGEYIGQFYGLEETQTEDWVKSHNIVAVHLEDWGLLGLKELRIRQGNSAITATVYDACSDADCSGCCTQNKGDNPYLIDMEINTLARFSPDSNDQPVQFQICD